MVNINNYYSIALLEAHNLGLRGGKWISVSTYKNPKIASIPPLKLHISPIKPDTIKVKEEGFDKDQTSTMSPAKEYGIHKLSYSSKIKTLPSIKTTDLRKSIESVRIGLKENKETRARYKSTTRAPNPIKEKSLAYFAQFQQRLQLYDQQPQKIKVVGTVNKFNNRYVKTGNKKKSRSKSTNDNSVHSSDTKIASIKQERPE